MPFVATWAAEWAAAYLADMAASSLIVVAAYAVTYVAVNAALMYGASLVLRSKPKAPSFVNDAAARTQMVRQAAASRRLIYGQVKVSGPLAYVGASGTNNEYIHLVVLLASHECQEIGDIYLNDETVPLDGSGNATGKYAGFVRVKKHLGTAGQAADTDLIAECSASEWTSAHTLSGIAYIYVRCKFDSKLFTSGLPNFAALVKGRRVYDPRSATTAYSNNAALCIYDYMLDTRYGLGATTADVDQTEIQAAANVCDESVALAAGGTESRYTINGTVDTAEKPSSIIEAMLSAMAGRVVFAGGSWFIQAGAYRTPTVTLTENELRGGISVQTKLSRRELVNGVKGVFVSPGNNWQPSDFPANNSNVAAANIVAGQRYCITTVGSTSWTAIGAASNTVGVCFTASGAGSGTGYADKYLGEDNGERLWLDIQLPYTTSASMAQRLAKISLERGRRQITVKTPCMLHALKVQAGDNTMLTNARMGWSSKVFETTEFQFSTFNDGDGNPALGVDLIHRETDSNVWVWSAEDVTLSSAPTTTLYNPFTVPAPTGFALTSGSSTVVIQPDGTVVPRLKAAWTAPADQFIQDGGTIRIQYKKFVDSVWTEWAVVRGDQVFDFITDVAAGVGYDVRIRGENLMGAYSSWVTVTNHVVVGDNTAPATPAGLTAIAGTGKSISLAWTANTEADLFEYGVYRNTTNTPSSATKIAETGSNRFVDVGVTPGVTYYYWITAVDGSENESSKSTVASTTPSGVAPNPVTIICGANTRDLGGGSIQKIGGSNTAWDAGAYSAETYVGGCRLQYKNNSGVAFMGAGLTLNNPASSDSYTDISYWLFSSSGSVDAYESGSFAQNLSSPVSDAVYGITYDGMFILYTVNGVVKRRVNVGAGLSFRMDCSFYTLNGVMDNIKFEPMGANTGGLNAQAATDPSAASKTAEGTYSSGDGTIFSYLQLSIPALPVTPVGAAYQNVLYKKTSGGGTWMVAAQLTNTGTATLRIDDLSPGVAYDVATIAYTQFDIPSNVVPATSSPFTAPGKSASSSQCTAVTPHAPSSTYPVRLAMDGAYRLYSCLVTFTDSTDKDVVMYEFGLSGTPATPPGGAGFVFVALGSGQFQFNTSSLGAQYLWYRTANSSGVWSSWADSGYNLNAYVVIPSGDMVEQSSNNVQVSAIKTGAAGASSIRQVVARYPFNGTVTLAGGSAEESFNISLTNRGFTTKPDVTAGKPDVTSDPAYQCRYDWDDGSNSSTNAVIKVSRVDGTNTVAGPVRVQNVFEQYT